MLERNVIVDIRNHTVSKKRRTPRKPLIRGFQGVIIREAWGI